PRGRRHQRTRRRNLRHLLDRHRVPLVKIAVIMKIERSQGADHDLQFMIARELRAPYLPSRAWPQTRTTLPVIPPDAGDASQDTVSATSTGSPPCAMLFIRRPASRTTTGIAAVMAVSMKPGATALT